MSDTPFEEELQRARRRARRALFDGPDAPRGIPRRVGRYAPLRILGTGGMGRVYEAFDEELGRRIAIKVLRSDRHAGSLGRQRMIAEARAMARVSHPNVIAVYEVGTHTESHASTSVFIAMELVDGQTLRQWVDERQPAPAEILRRYREAAAGLAAIHAAGLVHRDVKPDNLMLDAAGRVRVMDLGLVRHAERARDTDPTNLPLPQAGEDTPVTRTGTVLGTPAYMAPEQFAGELVDAASDQFSFCVALYEALWARRPFSGATPLVLATRVQAGAIEPTPRLAGVSNRVRRAILRGLSTRREARWPSMEALARALSPNRTRLGTRAGALIAVTGLGLAWSTGDGSPERCRGSGSAFEATWSAERRDALRRAFVEAAPAYGGPIGDATIEALDAYRSQWARTHRDVCRTTWELRTRSADDFEGGMRCLGRRRHEADALIGAMLEVGEEGILRAPSAVASLLDPSLCAQLDFVRAAQEPAGDPATVAEVSRLRTELAATRALDDLGELERAGAKIDTLIRAADAVGYPPLRAEVAVGAAVMAALRAPGTEESSERLRRAFFDAREAGAYRAAAVAALNLAAGLASRQQPERARTWMEHGRAHASAAGATDLDTMILEAEAIFAISDGRLEDAIALTMRRLTLVESACRRTSTCPELGPLHDDLSAIQTQAGHLTAALESARRSVALTTELGGPQHPHLGSALLHEGEILLALGRPDQATPPLRQAVAIREKHYGPTHPDVMSTQAALGAALVGSGSVDEGLALLATAAATAETSDAANLAAAVLNRVGMVYSDTGREDEARRAYEGALRALQQAHPDGHPAIAVILSNIAHMDFMAGQYEVALEGFTEALALERRLRPGHDPNRAGTLHNRGRALAELGRDEEAIADLREARTLLADEALQPPMVQIAVHLAAALRRLGHAHEARVVLDTARERCATATEQSAAGAGCDDLPPPPHAE